MHPSDSVPRLTVIRREERAADLEKQVCATLAYIYIYNDPGH
jgi:hypothetical protein